MKTILNSEWKRVLIQAGKFSVLSPLPVMFFIEEFRSIQSAIRNYKGDCNDVIVRWASFYGPVLVN